MEDVNLKLFSMIKVINESKALPKHIPCECRRGFDDRTCFSRQKQNNDKCHCGCKKPIIHRICEEKYVWNPIACSCECDRDCDMDGYLKYCACVKRLDDDLVVT